MLKWVRFLKIKWIGGCNVVLEMAESEELKELLERLGEAVFR